MKTAGWCWLLLGFVVVGSSGCGDQPAVSSSTEEAQVKGTVKIKGKPVAKGEVVFNPSNYQRAVPQKRVPINSDGTYAIKTLVGGNTVSVSIPKAPIKGLEYEEISFDVKSGDNTLDLEFPRSGN
jgi:hypothetical protein